MNKHPSDADFVIAGEVMYGVYLHPNADRDRRLGHRGVARPFRGTGLYGDVRTLCGITGHGYIATHGDGEPCPICHQAEVKVPSRFMLSLADSVRAAGQNVATLLFEVDAANARGESEWTESDMIERYAEILRDGMEDVTDLKQRLAEALEERRVA